MKCLGLTSGFSLERQATSSETQSLFYDINKTFEKRRFKEILNLPLKIITFVSLPSVGTKFLKWSFTTSSSLSIFG